ncbi:MAG: hypothetical protein IJ764_06430 [Bacteroidales bacterium]|nr:hypothetical protein [Bacteroidales bacterium]
MGITGAAIGAAGSIFGGWQSANAERKNISAIQGMKDDVAARQQQNQDWFDKAYNEDATMRADAQNALRRTEEAIKNRAKQAAGTAAVMGGTEESQAVSKDANARALTDTMGSIAAAGAARKDAVENQYLSQRDSLDSAMRDLQFKENEARTAKANAISEAIQGVTSAVGQLPI